MEEDEVKTITIKMVEVKSPVVGIIKKIDELTLVAAFNRGYFVIKTAAVIEALEEKDCYRFIPLENFGKVEEI